MKIMSVFRRPTPLEVATQELIQAEHAKLAAETGLEFAQSSVAYNQARITRLKKYIHDVTEEAAE